MTYYKCKYAQKGFCTFSLSIEQQYENEKNGIPLDLCDGFCYIDLNPLHPNCEMHQLYEEKGWL